MTLRIISFLFGLAFIAVGVAGHMPSLMENGLLFGIFEIDNMHNLVHIVTGAIAVLAATRSRYSKLFFQVFGFIYLIVGMAGFVLNGDLMIMHVNTADNVLHLVIGIVALFIGFTFRIPIGG